MMDQAQQLRNIIKKQNQHQHTARVITITSGKGGVGKSSISVNLAIQISRLGKRVVILDADFGLANVEIMFGIRPRYSLLDVLKGDKALRDVIMEGPEGIGFISGGSGIRELTNLNKDEIQSFIRMMYELDQIADIVIVDTGAGISDTVIELVAASTEVLLVATPEPTSITDAYALLKTLHRKQEYHNNEIKIKMIGNQISSYEEGKELFDKLYVVVSKFLDIQLEYLGTIPYDGHIPKAIMKQQPISLAYPNAAAARALFELAMVLSEVEMQGIKPKKGIAGLFANMYANRVKNKH